jgi:type VI secretion system secreted protein Hcp
MALIAYMSVNGKKQGDIKGGSTQGGDKKDKIEVYGSDHTVEIPKDTHTGLPTGQRIHHPFKVIKRKDKASPKLFKACCTGEQCTVELDYFEIKPDGAESKYYSVKLENAIVVSMREHTPLTFLPDNKPYHDMEDVCFTYSKITWTYSDGNIEFTDDWQGVPK